MDGNDDELFKTHQQNKIFKANAAILDGDSRAEESDEMLVNESIEQINLFVHRQETERIQMESQTLEEQDSSVFRVSSEVIEATSSDLIDVNRIRGPLVHKEEKPTWFSTNQESTMPEKIFESVHAPHGSKRDYTSSQKDE